ncbi:unnamed protein product, partial [Rotaria magnacalcarata]
MPKLDKFKFNIRSTG